jgi:hypothetical protein
MPVLAFSRIKNIEGARLGPVPAPKIGRSTRPVRRELPATETHEVRARLPPTPDAPRAAFPPDGGQEQRLGASKRIPIRFLPPRATSRWESVDPTGPAGPRPGVLLFPQPRAARDVWCGQHASKKKKKGALRNLRNLRNLGVDRSADYKRFGSDSGLQAAKFRKFR